MSMLKYFFDINENGENLFEELKISRYKDIMEKRGKYPVIFLSFKDIKFSKWKDVEESLKLIISYLYTQNRYVLNGNVLTEKEKSYFEDIEFRRATFTEYIKSLFNLTYFLYKYHNNRVTLLIDEYDIPIQQGFIHGFFEEVIEYMRNFMGNVMKDNPYIEKAVLSGILRVGKENIFSGLNNLKVATITTDHYSQYFGFLESEVEEMLKYYCVEYKIDEVRHWYNGYSFGKNLVYNPWSIINFIDNYQDGFRPYWVNTAENSIIKRLLAKGGETLKEELKLLIEGQTIEKKIDENIVLNEIDKNSESIWSFLLLTGYLNSIKSLFKEDAFYCVLNIPNREVKGLFKNIVTTWFNETAGSEKFYHAFVLGMLVSLEGRYEIKSNRESGYGRYDIMMIPKNKNDRGIIIEFKKANTRRGETLEEAVKAALSQIKDKNYKLELESLGINNILEVGIAFLDKEVMVKGSL